MYEQLDKLKAQLDVHRPFSAEQQAKLDSELIPRRIYYTNVFEDNTLTLEETRYYIENNRMTGGKLEREFHEVKGLVEAIFYLRRLQEESRDLDEDCIKELHKILTAPIEQEERYYPGEFRSLDSSILGAEGSKINFVSHKRVPNEIDALLKWYHERSASLHPAERATRFHYRFSLIHPFADGNGRVARLLDDFILEKAGYGPIIIEDRTKYFDAHRQPDSALPSKNRLAASEDVDLSAFVAAICEASSLSMQLMLDIIEDRFKPTPVDLSTRMKLFDQTISGDTATEADRRAQEEKEATKLAIGREISELLKDRVQSKYVQFGLSGPAKFQQNNHQYSPLIAEVTARHKFTFSPSEGLYEYHFVPDLEGVEKAGMPLEPFMKLMSFAIISHDKTVGVFSGLLTFEFGRVYIKQENREEIVMRLDKDSIRELLGPTSYTEWDTKQLNKFVYNSLDYYLHRIESEYQEARNQSG